MTLVVDELFDNIIAPQPFRIKQSIQVAHVRPWIIKWGTPPGEMVLELYQNGELLTESRLTSTEINAQIPASFAHGQLRFDFPALQLNHDYSAEYTDYEWRLRVEAGGTDQNNFYGIVRRYEQKIYETYGQDVVNGESPNDMIEPFGFEIFEYNV